MGSKLEKLDTEVRIPFDEEALLSGDPVRTTDYFLELVKTLQEQFESITITSNYTVDIVDGEAIYFSLRGSDGEYPDGTWRRIQIGNNLELQRKVGGSWLTIQIREPIDGVIDALLMDIAIDENKLKNLAILIAAALELGVLGFLDSVDTGQIVNNAVTKDKLRDLSVTLDKLADNAVSSDKIIDTAITEAKLAALSVSLGKLAANSVDKDKLTVLGVDADGKLVLGQIGSGDADNIDASATRKWAGETGADVTADHAVDVIFYSASEPSHKTGRLWFDTNTDLLKRSTGSAWDTVGDETALHQADVILDNITDGTTYKKYLDTERTKLTGVETSADVTGDHPQDVIYYGASTPGHKAGRLWFDTSVNLLKRSTGAAWQTVGDETSLKQSLTVASLSGLDADDLAESAAKKWAGETGADVTGDHTAANVTGQGALATLNTVNTAQIDNDAITASKILALEIGTGHLAALAVTAGKIDALAIETDKLAANAVTAAKITAGTITATEMAALSIGTSELIAESITAAKIASLAIETDKIAANAITATKIFVVSLGAIVATLGTVVAGNITGTTITGGIIRTAATGRRIKMDSDGIKFMSAAPASGKIGTTGNGGDNIVIGTTGNGGDNEIIGSGYLVRFYNMTNGVPFYVQSEQTVADIHYFNRANPPSGAAEVGDTCVVQGKHETCTVTGTPGTWVVTGDQAA